MNIKPWRYNSKSHVICLIVPDDEMLFVGLLEYYDYVSYLLYCHPRVNDLWDDTE